MKHRVLTLLLTVIFTLSGSGAHAGLWCNWNGHQGLADGPLPALGHLQPHATSSQRRVVDVEMGAAGVLPYVVHHGGSDDLEAVRIAPQG